MRMLIVLLIVAVTGCVPATVEGLKEKPAGRASFEVNRHYQPVYRTILSQARKCYQIGFGYGQLVVNGDLYTDLKTGTVAVTGGVGVNTFFAVEITALSDEVTRVDTYYAIATWAHAARAVQAWVKDDAPGCSG